MKHLSFAALYCLLLIACMKVPAATTNVASSLEMARTKCGYELENLEPLILNVQTDSMANGGVQQTYMLEWEQGTKNFRAALTLNCAPIDLHEPDSSIPVSAPKDLIVEEDSGGRYMRHVAWQKSIVAINWPVNVAYIDYIFGDGQRTDANYLLACNSEIATPCISLSINEPSELSENDIVSALSIFKKISVTH